MNMVRHRFLSLSDWLRRPERFVCKLQTMIRGKEFPRLQDLDRLIAEHGIELVETTLGPRVEGLAHREGDQLMILLRRDLTPLNREFVLAHEMGHFYLHLSNGNDADDLTAYVPGGDIDVEADAFAIACLVESLPPDRRIEVGLSYMLTNPNMARRAFRVILYLTGYSARVKLANVLDRMLLTQPTKGTA